ncbi:hypothetical protein SUGI_0564880 [Cryptomeria japonica]|nr:hypothetical protein SUGI_0564880 [Cryptomeria japonica]
MISGSIPQQIVNLTNLTLLNLGRNLFSGNIPSGIKRFRELERLYLFGNKLGGGIPRNIPVSLEGCQKLELLDLSYNKLGGRIPREVTASLTNLQFYLNLSWNSLEGSLPQEMSKIVTAQAIDISGNRLTGVIPISVGDCTALEHLNLFHNSFEGTIPDSLSKLKNLQQLDLSFNNLSGQIPGGELFPNRSVGTLFMRNPDLCGPKIYSLPPCLNQTQGKHSLPRKIVLSVVGTTAFLLCLFLMGMLWRHKFSKQLVRPSSFIFRGLHYQKKSYQDLVIVTSEFDESNLLGVGSFGSVYKGILRDGKIVAVKALNLQNEEADKSFVMEYKLLGKIRHRNLIKIISAFYYPGFKVSV